MGKALFYIRRLACLVAGAFAPTSYVLLPYRLRGFLRAAFALWLYVFLGSSNNERDLRIVLNTQFGDLFFVKRVSRIWGLRKLFVSKVSAHAPRLYSNILRRVRAVVLYTVCGTVHLGRLLSSSAFWGVNFVVRMAYHIRNRLYYLSRRTSSTMRLTRSATVMPSRLASACSHFICGSVKSMERFMGVTHSTLVEPCQ